MYDTLMIDETIDVRGYFKENSSIRKTAQVTN